MSFCLIKSLHLPSWIHHCVTRHLTCVFCNVVQTLVGLNQCEVSYFIFIKQCFNTSIVVIFFGIIPQCVNWTLVWPRQPISVYRGQHSTDKVYLCLLISQVFTFLPPALSWPPPWPTLIFIAHDKTESLYETTPNQMLWFQLSNDVGFLKINVPLMQHKTNSDAWGLLFIGFPQCNMNLNDWHCG